MLLQMLEKIAVVLRRVQRTSVEIYRVRHHDARFVEGRSASRRRKWRNERQQDQERYHARDHRPPKAVFMVGDVISLTHEVSLPGGLVFRQPQPAVAR